VKGRPFALDAIGGLGAPRRHLGVDLDEEGLVRQPAPDRVHVHLEDGTDAEAARDALVGEGGVDVAIADHVAAGLERRGDNAVDELCAGRGEEGRLRPGGHLDSFEQQATDFLPEGSPAGLACRHDLATLGAQRLGEELGLRRLSRPVHTFEGDEHCRRTIRPVRAVVTGGAGFIGSHVVDALLARGDEVHVLDDFSSGKRDNVPSRARVHEGDIRSDTDRVFDEVFPEVVFHLAAQADVRVSVERPDHDADVNVIGTIHVLEAARRHGARIVFSSTGGAIYGECEGPAAEDHPREPVAPYGVSKLAGEEYIAAWNRLYGAGHVSLRFGNVYGPRQDPHGEAGVVAIFMNLLREGGTPKVFGDGTQTRDYVYVGDVVAATLAAANRDGGVFNVGTGEETSVLDLYERIQRAAGVEREPELAPPRPGELQRSVLDASRAQRELGWKPKHSLDEGLAETWAWISAG
jgi:UDP-glucose 4-epimerase